MKNTLFFILTVTFLQLSCKQHEKLGENKLDIEHIAMNFDVPDFYGSEIEKEKRYERLSDSILALDLKKLPVEELDDLAEKEYEYRDFYDIEIYTLFTGNRFEDDLGDSLAIQYNMNSWRPDDTIAYYDKMPFQKINMMTSLDGDFMGLVALNESEDYKNFKQLLGHIESKNGKAKVLEKDFFGAYYLYYWELADRLLAIASVYDDKENVLKIDVQFTEDSLVVDTTKHPSANTYLFVHNNKYIGDSVINKLNRGDWIYFWKLYKEKE